MENTTSTTIETTTAKPAVKKATAKPAVKKATAKPAVKKATAKPAAKKATAKKPAAKKATAKPAVKSDVQPHVVKSKRAVCIELMQRKQGATLADLMAATQWQAHSVRGFLSVHGRAWGDDYRVTFGETGTRSYHVEKGVK